RSHDGRTRDHHVALRQQPGQSQQRAAGVRRSVQVIRTSARESRMFRPLVLTISAAAVALAFSVIETMPAQAQLFKLTKEQLVAYTAQNPFDRFEDGRPKVPDALIARMKDLSAEEVWAVLPGKGFRNQWADGFEVLHPGTKMVGRAFTVQFMPARPDTGIPSIGNQFAIDMLQPGDVLVVDLFGKKQGGTIVGDNLFYYVQKATHGGGLVVDGSIRDLEGIAEMPMPA